VSINLVPLLLLLGGLVSLVLMAACLRTTKSTTSIVLGLLSLLSACVFGTAGAGMLFALVLLAS